MKQLRVGLIGCGTMMGAHVADTNKLKTSKIVAVCDIISKNAQEVAKVLESPKIFTNYKEMVEKANDTGALELIRQELSKNPRMSGISLETNSMGIKSLASALQMFNVENYDGLMNNITNMLNYSMNYTDENQLTFVKNNLSALINNYGIRAGQDIIDSVSDELINDVMRGKSSVSVEDIREFWDKYSVVTDTNTSTQPQTTPPAENSNEPSENEEPENETPENETPENETPENETPENEEPVNGSSENEDVDSGEEEKETLNTFF